MTSFTPVKDIALKQKLNIFQPQNLSAKVPIKYIKELEADIFIVFSFGKILTNELLNIPKLFALNIHASLLPKYRGAAPINWALINGETKTGITIIKMNERMDEGDILLKKVIKIDYSNNAVALENKLAGLASFSLQEALLKIEKNEFCFLKQNAKGASFAPKLKKDDGRINWNREAEQIRNQIRGCLPWPGTFTFYKNKLIKIWNAEVAGMQIQGKYLPGSIISFDKKGILVSAKDKALLIKELQLSSGKRMDAWQFIQGHKVEKGNKFD